MSFKYHVIRSTFLGISLLFTCNAYADLTITQGTVQKTITDKDLQQLHLATVDIQDPVYNKPKRYGGYWLSDIMVLAGIKPHPNAVWVFTALDGYKARISEENLLRSKAKALVAIKDLDAPAGWEKFLEGKAWITPAPYYLVWETLLDSPADIKLPWPYQIAGISLENTDQNSPFSNDSTQSASVQRGSKIFQQNCIACHSLNLQGGTVGPELNVPQNVLEYENRKFLKRFIQDPSSFRSHDKMPAFKTQLSGQSIEDVLDFLAWMGKHKQ